jgi:hypothetical protein
MSVITLFPGTPDPQKPAQDDLEREIATRFGLVPNFFRSAPEAPYVVGLPERSNPNALQGAAFCLSLSLLRGALLHHPTLRVFVGAWSGRRRPQRASNDDRPGRSITSATPAYRRTH